MNKLGRKISIIIGILFLCGWTHRSFAQDFQTISPYDYRHIMGGHVFLPSIAFPSAFADSHANLALGMGYGTYSTPTPLGGTADLNLGTISPIIGGQVQFLSRFAVSFSLTGNLIAGLNTESALEYGASTSYSWNLGLLGEILRSNQSVLSLALLVNRPHTLAVSPLNAVVEGIQSAAAGLNSEIANSSARTQWKPSFRFSYALNPVFGLRSLLGMNFISFEQNNDSSSSTRINLGIGLEANLAPITPIPIAITANYARGQILTEGVPNSDTFTLGIFETLSPTFNAGFEVGKVWLSGSNATLVVAAIRSYYN